MASKDTNTPSTSAPVVFTEDGIVVRTLYMRNIPVKTSEEMIKTYFSTFGTVTSVVIITKGTSHPKHRRPKAGIGFYRYGFITFEKPESAAEALTKDHRLFSKQLKVRVADTWQQPPYVQLPTVNGNIECNEDDDIQTGATILDLNDDCLLHMFAYLGSVERLKMSLVCLRFKYLNESLIKVNYLFDFNEMETFTLMETRQILSLFGSHIRRVHLEKSTDTSRRHLEFIPRYCKNAEELDFEMLQNIHFQTYWKLFSYLKQIKAVKLENCDINNEICSLIAKQQGLERLNLSHNCDITGEHLHKLRNLNELNLANCENFETKDFIDICQTNKLKTLNIVGCYQLNDAAFDILVSTQTDLEQIIISNSYHACNIGVVGNLANLKHIQIHREGGAYFGTDILKEVAQNRKEELESLEIYNLLATMEQDNRERILELRNLKKLCLVRDKFLDDTYLIEITKNCSKLVELNIAGSISVTAEAIRTVVSTLEQLELLNISFCDQFKDTLYHQLIIVLLEKNSRPLTLCVSETNIKPPILKTKKYKQHKKLLALDFEVDDFYYKIVDFLSDDDINDLSDVLEYFNDDSDDFDLDDLDDFFSDSDEIPIHLLW